MTYLITFFIGIIVSFYGVSIGGGGLLLVPVLVFLGLETKEAIATAIFANIITSGMGFYEFKKFKKIDLKLSLWASLEFGSAAVIGSLILISLPEELIKKMVAVFLLILLIIALFSKKIGLQKIKVSSFKKVLGHLALWFNGLYKGLIHSGSSILESYIFIYLFGQTYLESSGTRKLPSLAASTFSIFILLKTDLIIYDLGVILMLGHLIGSYLGSNYALKRGELWMKHAFALIVGISAIKLLL